MRIRTFKGGYDEPVMLDIDRVICVDMLKPADDGNYAGCAVYLHTGATPMQVIVTDSVDEIVRMLEGTES